MQTAEEQMEFFEAQKPALLEHARTGNAEAVVRFVESFEDPLQRRVLWFFSRQALMLDPEGGVALDVYVDVARAAIRACLADAEAEADEESRKRRRDLANILSYNLAADLADCWEDDGKTREPRHFEVGLEASLDCIRWRDELEKPAGPKSMAWWARGMHELGLGHARNAASSFERSLQYARNANPEDSEAFGIVLAQGYLAIARRRCGDEGAAQLFDEAVARFEAQAAAEGDEAVLRRAADAGFGLQQLRTVADRYPPSAGS